MDIQFNKTRIRKSGFPTAEDAARFYDSVAIKNHGEFARLNFPK